MPHKDPLVRKDYFKHYFPRYYTLHREELLAGMKERYHWLVQEGRCCKCGAIKIEEEKPFARCMACCQNDSRAVRGMGRRRYETNHEAITK